MDIDDRQQLAMELYRGGGTLGKRSTLARKHLAPPGPPMLGKSPPRPSPASVAYHSDEESLKGYDENPDDSSVTEKPSEISSSESQVCAYFNFYFILLKIKVGPKFILLSKVLSSKFH